MRPGWGWLLLNAVCAIANAGPPPPASPPPTPPPKPPTSTADAPDESFLEFLGSDDVGDSAVWEYLKKAPAHGSNPPPPQDAKK